MAEVFDEIKALLSTIKSKTNTHIREFRSFRDQVDSSIISLRDDLSSLNDSVSNLSMCLQEHKQQTAAELAQLQTSLNTTQSSLVNQRLDRISSKLEVLNASFSQSKQQTETGLAQLYTLHTSLNATQSSLIQQVNVKLNTLTTNLSQHQQQTAAELAQIQTSLQSSLATHTQQVNAKLNTLTASLSQHQQQTAAQLQTSLNTTQSSLESKLDRLSFLREDMSSLNDSVSNLSMCLQEQTQQTAAELAQLQTSLQSSLTTHTQQVNAKLNTLTASLSQHQQQRAANVQQLNSSLDKCTTFQQCDSQQDSPTPTTITTPECPMTASPIPTPATTPTITPHTCGGTGGWRRVVYLDMTDPSTTCPSGWQLTGYSKRTCGRASDGFLTCDSVTFPVSGGEYSRVCGRIKAYQWGGTFAFYSYHRGQVTTIDGGYVDGISLTYSNPRHHIWTFAAGAAEGNPSVTWVCPCDGSDTTRIPPFVRNNYFCESGVNEPWDWGRHATLHSNDTLWDGENCLSSSTCCSLHNPPYFVKQLPTLTTDDIEARICLSDPLQNDPVRSANIAVELIELYVQ